MKMQKILIMSVLIFSNILLAQQPFGPVSLSISGNNFNVSGVTGNFTQIKGTAGAATPSFIGTADEGAWANVPIGFNFNYLGATYTSVSATTNGWLTLLNNPNFQNYTPINSLTNGGIRPLLAPLWDDLDINMDNFSYKTFSDTMFVAEWLDAKWGRTSQNPVMSFQVKLYKNGKIEFLYTEGSFGSWNPTSPSASIGIAGVTQGTGNFISMDNNFTFPTSNTELTITTKPQNNQLFIFAPTTIMGVNTQQISTTPQQFSLEQNFPNPFNPATTIQFSLPAKAFVSLKVFDILGNEVETLVNEVKPTGTHQAQFTASRLSSGMYFYKLISGNNVEIKKMLLVK